MNNDRLGIVIDERLSALHSTPESKEKIMKRIRGEHSMKRNLRLVPIMVALIILVLTTIAFAMSTNLFGFFTNRFANEERNTPLEHAAEYATLSTNEPVSISKTGWIDEDSTLFDGQRLIVAYKLEDKANIVETWQPTQDELDRMSAVSSGMLPMFQNRNDSVNAFYSNYNAGMPCGLHIVETSRLDHTYTEDGIDLRYTDSGSMIENGISFNYLLFDELPEEVQKRDVVNIVLRFIQTEQWYWFDGENLFVNTLASEDGEQSAVFTAHKNQ